jgi:hypothetical protein
LLIWTDGVIGGAFIISGEWELPSPSEIFDPGVVVGILLGIATLFALIITFIQLKDHLRPQAMGFDTALKSLVKFMERWQTEDMENIEFRLCSYYPSIGAVTRTDYLDAYNKFVDTFRSKRSKIRCICLKVLDTSHNSFNRKKDEDCGEDFIMNEEDLMLLSSELIYRRPDSIESTVASFAQMWHLQKKDSSKKPRDIYLDGMKAILEEISILKNGKRIGFVEGVPDFHFMLALKKRQFPIAGYLLLPLRPSGMPAPKNSNSMTPPMLGVEIHDLEILVHLKHLYDDLSPDQNKHFDVEIT